MKNKIFTLLVLSLIGSYVFAQSDYLLNPSFEDELQFGISPEEWATYDAKSTPDVQPGYVGVNLEASHGNTYLGLVMRGNKFPKPKSESVQAELMQMLEKEVTYKFEIDLAAPGAYEEKCGKKIIEYKDIPQLKFLGIRNDCYEGDLLYETQPIENKAWLTHIFEVTPSRDYNYIKLELSLDNSKASYIVCDNFRITKVEKDEIDANEIVLSVPNLLTPNNDGKNDYFIIKNLPKHTKLTVFNRNQQILYENDSYNNSWEGTGKDGKILPTGTYFYKLNVPNTDKKYMGFFVIKNN